MNVAALIDQRDSLLRFGLLAERCDDGSLHANVTHVRHHSPTGYDCGYHGSGPADLALSVLHALIPPLPEAEEDAQHELTGAEFEAALDDPSRWSERIGIDQIRVSKLAYLLHQRFKEAFIARIPVDGGYIPITEIRTWIEEQKARLAMRA